MATKISKEDREFLEQHKFKVFRTQTGLIPDHDDAYFLVFCGNVSPKGEHLYAGLVASIEHELNRIEDMKDYYGNVAGHPLADVDWIDIQDLPAAKAIADGSASPHA